MKKTFILPLLLICITSVNAQKVDSKTADAAATAFWQKSFSNTANMNLAYTICKQADTALYVYNADDKGFVIISGNYSAAPVLAYSDEGNFKPSNLAPATTYWLMKYANQIFSLGNTSQRQLKNQDWAALLSDDNSMFQNKTSKIVAALVQTRWDQGKYYNYMCPAYASGPDGHCVTGCVATAMAQIMRYYNYPETGTGSHYYLHPHFGYIGADFGATTYDWTLMGNSGNVTNETAIGTLIFHCGVSVDMDYNPSESGAMSENAVTALKNYFHYRPTTTMLSKSDYDFEPDWIAVLKENLDENHPVMYSGSGAGGGHAWVCDGYDASNNFHMNWGWSGSSNGYFAISALNPGGFDFNSGETAIVNIAPYFAPYCMANRTFTDSTRVISDGSGYSYYWNNTQCDWLITPTGAERVMLQFADFNTEAGKDVLSVYDGTTTSDPLLGSYSGTDVPPLLTATSGKMLITFSSDSTTQGQGWSAKYWALKHGDGIQEDESSSLSVYPNPVTNQLTVSNAVTFNEAVNIRIYDYSGKEVYIETRMMNGGNSVKIDVGRLNEGFYMVSLQSQHHNCRAKFVKGK
jgi:hypothetical protein